MPGIDEKYFTTNIDQPGRFRTLQSTVSEMGLNEKIVETKATAQAEGQSDIDDDQTDKKQMYGTDIRQLVQGEIVALCI